LLSSTRFSANSNLSSVGRLGSESGAPGVPIDTSFRSAAFSRVSSAAQVIAAAHPTKAIDKNPAAPTAREEWRLG
jgi:hypothetical protein